MVGPLSTTRIIRPADLGSASVVPSNKGVSGKLKAAMQTGAVVANGAVRPGNSVARSERAGGDRGHGRFAADLDMSRMSADEIGALTTAEVGSLSKKSLQSLSASQISAFDPADIAGLSVKQLSALTSEDVAAMTDSQVSALTPDQLMKMGRNKLSVIASDFAPVLSDSQIAAMVEAMAPRYGEKLLADRGA